jgi:hypothetical protein
MLGFYVERASREKGKVFTISYLFWLFELWILAFGILISLFPLWHFIAQRFSPFPGENTGQTLFLFPPRFAHQCTPDGLSRFPRQ